MTILKVAVNSLLICLSFSCVSCQMKPEDKTNSDKAKQLVNTSLLDKSLPEIKDLVKGKWELISGKNNSQLCEFENTYIEFDGDNYIWIEDGKSEPGKLNWRKSDTGAGYEAFLMDAFYETNPAYPVYIKGDTLAIQDCTKTAYLYTLVKSEEYTFSHIV